MTEENLQPQQTQTDVVVEQPKQPEPQTQPVEQQPQPFKMFSTQEDYDNETAKIRGVAERKAKSEFLKTLGIDSEDKLEAIKKAYENSLTEQDRINEQLKELGAIKSELAESKAIITALSKTSNRPAEEITKLVKMAKGLVSDDVTIEQALDEVMKMIQPAQPQKPTIPVSQQISSNAGNIPVAPANPFKDGNMTEMGRLIKENPEKARELAKLANYPITF